MKKNYKINPVEEWISNDLQSPASMKNDSQNACLLARVKAGNYRLAEAYALKEGPDFDPFQTIRTLISLGNHQDAERLLVENVIKPESDEVRAEIFLEFGRVYFQQGRYEDALTALENAFHNKSLRAISRLTVLQVRAACFFELKDYSNCIRDCDRAISMGNLFPKALAVFYAKVFKIKSTLRMTDPSQARSLFVNLVAESLQQPMNADTCLSLLRVDLDWKRIQSLPVFEIALSTYWIAQAMGDSLYEGLAVVDMLHSEDEIGREWGRSKIDRYRKNHLKIETILNSQVTPELHASQITRSFLSPDIVPENILILDFRVRLSLKTLVCKPIKISTQSRNILIQLANGSIEKRILFEKIWGFKYHESKHDAVLKNAISRTRTQSGLRIATASGTVHCEDLILNLGVNSR